MITFDTQRHGAVPFWFWNGEQQEEEITRQLELAAAGGLKGLAIHARHGNRTEYMSERWLALTRHSCSEARRLGLDLWLYDEEGFPSGTVGHRLQKDDPRYQQKLLSYGYFPGARLGGVDHLLAAYDAVTRERLDAQDVRDEQEVLAFWISHLPRYVDTLKRETVERFIDMTHRKYYEALKEYFGIPITHIYTDDLNSNLDRGPSLPYTEELPAIFAERLGYSLLDHLPALIENVPGCEKVRLDFRGLVLDLFLHEFVSPMHQWCEAHGVLFTGHLSGDEGEINKSVHRFGAAMPFYEHEHIPGVDDFLCAVPSGCYLDQLRNPQNHCPVIIFKQASSVANQLKDGACSSECLTFLGWGAAVWGQSALLNYELALGINLLTHHDFSYATGGVAKRDCPPSYFFQQPYWPQYKGFHDALARSMQLLKRGTYEASTLVIHPMSSCWLAMDGQQISIAEPFKTRTDAMHPDPLRLEESLAAVSHELLKLQVGFEYGDEWVLAKHGSVQDGQLQVGAMAYGTVIIPEVSNLLGSTVTLLAAFQAGGGQLIAINPTADCLVDGEMPERAVFGKKSSPAATTSSYMDSQLTPETIDRPEALRECKLMPTIELNVAEANAPVICHTRNVDGSKEHFICNSSDRSQWIRWESPLVAYDPVENCVVATVDSALVLPPFQTIHLLPQAPSDVPIQPVAQSLFGEPPKEAVDIPAASWRITTEQPNLMLVDWCTLPDGQTVYHTDKTISADVGALSSIVDMPDPDLIKMIAGESVTLETMRINGVRVPAAVGTHPSSQDMVMVDAAGLFVQGSNRIEFSRLSGDVLFEPFYLMGDFGVELMGTGRGMRPELTALQPAFGDLVECGLPFYWGGVRYEAELPGASGTEWLDCGEVAGVVTLSVNGVQAGCRYAPPYRFYLADYLTADTNAVVLTLYNTAQNLYGPHRRDYGVALHPCQRRGTGSGDYYLARFGIHGPTTAFWHMPEDGI